MPARPIARVALGLVAGASIWSLTEYATHRWVLHGQVRLGGLHRAHHRRPLHTSRAARTGGHAAVAAAAAAAAVGLGQVVPAAIARSAAAAFAGGYSTYEINHWNLHHRPPRTRRGERLRRRHDQHHYGAPGSNLGVTMAFWDHVFGTEATAELTTR